MPRLRFSRRVKALGVTTVVVALKCTFITANDEWPEVFYWWKSKSCKLVNTLTRGQSEQLDKKEVVILGTGWGALAAIQTLDLEKCSLTVVSPRPFFFYTPLLAGMAAGNVSFSSILEPIRKHLLGFPDAKYVQGECTEVNFLEQSVTVKEERTNEHDKSQKVATVNVPYDQLVIAIGAEPATFNIPGVRENCMFIKEIDDGIKIHHRILQSLEHANTLAEAGAPDSEIDRVLHWVVIGGGPTGVELTAELGDFVRNDVSRYFPRLKNRIKITLLEATDKILGMFDPAVSSYAASVLIQNGAHIQCNAIVTKVDERAIEYKAKSRNSGDTEDVTIQNLDYGTAVWAGGINKRALTTYITSAVNKLKDAEASHSSPQLSPRGIIVDEKVRVRGLEHQNNVFAIGDCAIVKGCSPTAQAAYQQGKYLGRLLREVHNSSTITSDTDMHTENVISQHKNFNFHNYGALAYVGTSKGVAELKTVLWSNPLESLLGMKNENGDVNGGSESETSSTVVEGGRAFIIWRSLYFSKLLSHRNKAQVAFDWLKCGVFGRDISSPYEIPSIKKKKS